MFFFSKNKKNIKLDYAKHEGYHVFYDLCDDERNKYSCVGGTARSLFIFMKRNHQKNL